MNKRSKGVTPVVAITLMILVTVAAAGTLYATMQDTQRAAEEKAPDINLNAENLNIESCWTEGSGPYETSLAIRNEASESMDNTRLDVIVDGREKAYDLDPEGVVDPQETFYLTFTDLSTEDEISGSSELTMFMGSNSLDYPPEACRS